MAIHITIDTSSWNKSRPRDDVPYEEWLAQACAACGCRRGRHTSGGNDEPVLHDCHQCRKCTGFAVVGGDPASLVAEWDALIREHGHGR